MGATPPHAGSHGSERVEAGYPDQDLEGGLSDIDIAAYFEELAPDVDVSDWVNIAESINEMNIEAALNWIAYYRRKLRELNEAEWALDT